MEIRIRAGKKAFELIKDGGFDFGRITTYVGPAVGPRWLIASGFDLTLLKTGVLGASRPILLAGASAGAWRFAAWLQPEPVKSYGRLLEAYIEQTYTREDNPLTVLKSLSRIVRSYIEDDALPFALVNKKYRLSITTARARHIAGSESPLLQKAALIGAYIGNAMSPKFLRAFYERVVFYYGPLPPRFCLNRNFKGRVVPLNVTNFKEALIASGAIPLLISGVRNIYSSPNGVYRDGGLLDYHLNQEYAFKEDEVTLFFHHQESIVPGWLDKRFKSRQKPSPLLDNVLTVYPREKFVQSLPNGKIPDRNDFVTFVDRPQERIEIWKEAVRRSANFGEEFLELVQSKKIRDLVEPF